MKKYLIGIPLFLVFVFAAGIQILSGQTHVFCPLDVACTWTAAQRFNNVVFGSAENVQWVDSAFFRGGGDVGAEINLAYAALPATGGKIELAINGSGTCYTQSAGIMLNTNGKPVILEAGGAYPACLIWSASVGAQMTIDWGGSVAVGAGVIRNIVLYGQCTTNACSGVTSAGISIGPVNGAGNFSFENVHIGTQNTVAIAGCPGVCGHLNGVLLGAGNNVGGNLYNVVLLGNNTGIQGGTQNFENFHMFGSFIAQNATGFNSNGAGDYYFTNVSWDDNTTVAVNSGNNSGITLLANHFENSGLGTCQYITATGNTVLTIYGGFMYNRHSGGSACSQLISYTGSTMLVDGLSISSAESLTQAFNLTGTPNAVHLRVVNATPSNLPEHNTFTSTRFWDCPLTSSATVVDCLWGDYNLIPGAQLGTTLGKVANPWASLFVGAAATNNIQLTGTATGTRVATLPDASITVSGAVFQDCGSTSGATQACAGTVKPTFYVVRGDVTLNSAATQSITTLPFTASSSFSCSGSDLTNAAGIISFNTYAFSVTASVTVQESGGGTSDHIRWQCAGF